MKNGKKSTAETVVYRSFDKVRERTQEDPLKIFKKAVDNIKPSLEVKSRRVGGSNYQVPVEVRPERRTSLSLRWLVNYARVRPEKTMIERLAAEMIDAAKAVGKLLAERAVKAGIKEVVFDRGGYLYHGRVKALAAAARESGLSV